MLSVVTFFKEQGIFVPIVESMLLGVVLHTVLAFKQELHPFEEWRRHSWRGFSQQDFDGILQVGAHDLLAARGVRATLAVATVCQTICNGKIRLQTTFLMS